MPDISAIKNRYSFDESRNLSCVRDYRAFHLPQPLCGKCTPSAAFGASSPDGGAKGIRLRHSHRHPPTRGEACHWILSRLRLPTARLSATHDGLRVADAPSNHVRCCDSSSLATASGHPDRLRDESVSLDFRSPSAPYKSSSLTFPSKEGGLWVL